jgi:hypothetical protein
MERRFPWPAPERLARVDSMLAVADSVGGLVLVNSARMVPVPHTGSAVDTDSAARLGPLAMALALLGLT